MRLPKKLINQISRVKGIPQGPPPESDGGSKAQIVAFCRASGLPEPVTEYRFHKTRRWRLDLAWPDKLIAVEIHGGVWTRGRHTRGAGFSKDCEKMSNAAILGWRVLACTTQQVDSGLALSWIEDALTR